MERVKSISHERVLVGPGTLYAMLAKFEENGVIRMTTSEGRRKSYIITETGREMLQKEYDRLMVMVEDGRLVWGGAKLSSFHTIKRPFYNILVADNPIYSDIITYKT